MNVLPTAQYPSPGATSLPAIDSNAQHAGAALRQALAGSSGSTAVPTDPMQAVASAPRSAREEAQDPAANGKVAQAVEDVQKFMDNLSPNLQFSIDDDSGKTVIKLLDRQTNEVIRQIPSEEMLDIARALGKLKGMLVEQKA